jgi:haloalkane dehalogenase
MKALTQKLVYWCLGSVTLLLMSGLALQYLIFPQPPVLTQAEYEALFPFQGHYAELDNGVRVHYVDEGEGRTLLLLHGNPTSAYLYRELIAELSHDYQVVAPDYPGFGQSSTPTDYGYTAQEQADTILSFFDHLNLNEVVVMVQDWGGPIGFNLVQQRPDRFAGLVIGNTWAWPLKGQRRFELFSWFMGGPIGKWLNKNHNGVLHMFLQRGMAQSLPVEEYAGYFQAFTEGDRNAVNRSAVTLFPRELITATPFLASVEKGMPSLVSYKALIVWGEQDFAFKETERLRFEAYFPRHHTELLAGAGHFIQDDAPDEIAAAIRTAFPPVVFSENPVEAGKTQYSQLPLKLSGTAALVADNQ